MSSIIFWPILKMCKMCHIWKASSVSKGIWCITCLSFLCNFYLNASLCISNFSKGMEKFLMPHTIQNTFSCPKILLLVKIILEKQYSRKKWKKIGKLNFWKKNWIWVQCVTQNTAHWKLLTFENSFPTRSKLQTKHHLENRKLSVYFFNDLKIAHQNVATFIFGAKIQADIFEVILYSIQLQKS